MTTPLNSPAITFKQFDNYESFTGRLLGKKSIGNLMRQWREEFVINNLETDKDVLSNFLKAEEVLDKLGRTRLGTNEWQNCVRQLSNWYINHSGLDKPLFEVGSLVRATSTWVGYEWEKDLAEVEMITGSQGIGKKYQFFDNNIGLVLGERLLTDEKTDSVNISFQRILLISIGIIHPYMTAKEIANSTYEVKQKTLLVPFSPFVGTPKSFVFRDQVSADFPFVLAEKVKKETLY